MNARLFYTAILGTYILLSSQLEAGEVNIQLVTENTPITRASLSTQKGGEATRFIQGVMDNADVDYTLSYLPWRRAYHNARAAPNVVIFPLARTAAREADFQWIGQLVPIKYYLFQLKARDDIRVQTLDDAKPYEIGVVNYHAHHELLLERKFAHLQPVNSSDQNIKKLLLGRIDFFSMSDGGIQPLCERTQIDCRKLKAAVELTGIAGGLYMALSNDSDPELARKLKVSFSQLVNDGTHEKVFAERFDRLENFSDNWQ